MQRFSALVTAYDPDADAARAGSGAAGGLGFALRTFLHADLQAGIDVVIRQTGMEEAIRKADVVVTGEGRLDAQTVMGKVPVGIAKIAKKYGLPVIAFCGSSRASSSFRVLCGCDESRTNPTSRPCTSAPLGCSTP